MNASNRIMILHSDPVESAALASFFHARGDYQAVCMPSSMEAIACFESFKPNIILIQADMPDIPPNVMVNTFLQLDAGLICWLVAPQPAQDLTDEAVSYGAYGVLALPLQPSDLAGLAAAPSQSGASGYNDDETLRGWVDDSFSNLENTSSGEMTQHADVINQKGVYRHAGDLHILGDLNGVKLLDVAGNISIDGDIIASLIRCDGRVMVKGGIVNCKKPLTSDSSEMLGVFCQEDLEVRDITASVIVCGKCLILGRSCSNSIVNVVERLVGKSLKTRIVGGSLRVGEHISIGFLGDKEQTDTIVELAAMVFYEGWKKSKRLMFETAQKRGGPRFQDKKAFEAALNDRSLYQRTADLLANGIFPGVNIRIGPCEDYVFELKEGPLRVGLGLHNGKPRVQFERK